MKSLKLTMVALAFTAVTATQAQATQLGEIFKDCGLGAMIFPDKGDEFLAVFTNVTWDLGTTATSSHISSKDACKGRDVKVAAFIGHSYDKLETEIAMGKGQYVETLAEITGKSVSKIRSSFAKVASNENFTNLTQREKASKLFNIVTL
jgi:hypothetical protein